MKQAALLRFFCCLALMLRIAAAQQQQFVNNVWMWGRYHHLAAQDTKWGATKITFSESNFDAIKDTNVSLYINGSFSGLGTQDGQYFIYTNGYTVCNKFHDTISNGAGINPGGLDSIDRPWGIRVPFNAVLLPYPGSDRLMALFTADCHYHGNGEYGARNVYYSLIDPSGNNGQGLVMIKNQLVFSDTLTNAGFSVVRHGNGRDWWLVIKRWVKSDFAKILLSAQGPAFVGFDTNLGPEYTQGGQGVFSPDGKTLAYFSNFFHLRLYDFDRCTGAISNLRYRDITHETAGGLAFSPSGRFLYINKWDSLWQFDMHAADVFDSQTFIAAYDHVPDPVTGWISAWAFMYPALDGKIYLQSFSGVMLNVINEPEQAGQACNFVSHQHQLPSYYFATVPTYVGLAD
jgi:hypothetical protein